MYPHIKCTPFDCRSDLCTLVMNHLSFHLGLAITTCPEPKDVGGGFPLKRGNMALDGLHGPHAQLRLAHRSWQVA